MVSATLEFGEHTALTDGGPDTIVTRKPEAWQLAAELGILDDIENPGSETKHIYVLDNGIPTAIPLSPIKFFTSPLLTGRESCACCWSLSSARGVITEQRSLAHFVTRRLGREALDKFIGPALGGIYNTDPELQSILVSSPIMREMEKESGGLFVAAIQRAFRSLEECAREQTESAFHQFQGRVAGIVKACLCS